MNFPIWFVISVGYFSILIIMGSIGHSQVAKSSEKLRDLPAENKLRLIKNYTLRIKIFKFYFWFFPLNVIIIPVLIYIYAPTEYLLHIIIILILSYVSALQMYRNNKFLIKLLEKA